MVQRLTQQRREQGKKTAAYQRLAARRYVTPSGYASYQSVLDRFAGNFAPMSESLRAMTMRDFTEGNSIAISEVLAEIQAPTYWLSRSLAEALHQTTLPNWIGDLNRPIPAAILMLPQQFLQTPDGEFVDYLAFVHCLPGDSLESGVAAGEVGHVVWTTALPSDIVYSRDIPLSPMETGENLFPRENLDYKLDNVDASAETAFTNAVDKLLVQTLLIMQLRPDLVELEQEQPISFGGKGFGKSTPRQSKFSPNWIGRTYRAPVEKELRAIASADGTRTHASPRTHWRKGHLRRVAVGPREQNQREWRWVEAVLVNPDRSGS